MTTTIKVTDSAGHVTTQTIDLVLQPSVIEASDFAVQNSCFFFPSGTVKGAGIDKTIYQMKPNTTTKTDPSTGTNPYRLMRVAGLTSANAAKFTGSDFTLSGTDQGGMYYGGLTLGWGSGSLLERIRINGIPGYSSGPPGETFTLALFHSDNATLNDLVLDGRDNSGAQVAATLAGYNFTTGVTTANNLKANYAKYGFAVAMWQCTGTQTFNGGDFSNCRAAINIEQAFGGVYNFNGTNLGTPTGKPWHAQISARQASAKVNFRNCGTNGKPLVVRTYPTATDNVQLDSDIKCFDAAGNDVTNNPAKFRISHNDNGT